MADFDPARLVQPAQLHRDIYLDPAVFALEMQRLWARAWLFVGHDSQIEAPGDYIVTSLAGQSVLMLRQLDGSVAVLHNRCAHKGAPIFSNCAGQAGRSLRCPYHGWSYRLDGSLLGVPMAPDYAGSGFEHCAASRGLSRYGEVASHRGFVFARASSRGPGFAESLGPLLPLLDLLAERSPQGRLRVAGGVIKTLVHANWKIYLENINDALHPLATHESASSAAKAVWDAQPSGAAVPPAMQQLLPFASGLQTFERMGARLYAHGHSVLGTQGSLHSGYAAAPGYAEMLQAAHGAQRAREVLAFVPQNLVCYPSLALKGAPQVLRVLRPLAADRTEVEAWALQPEGAPDELLASALLYNRQVFSPLSIVAHDDLHLFEGIQRALAARTNPWISLHRGAGTTAALPREVSGIDEALMRNQYQAWAEGMAGAHEELPG